MVSSDPQELRLIVHFWSVVGSFQVNKLFEKLALVENIVPQNITESQTSEFCQLTSIMQCETVIKVHGGRIANW